MMSARTVAVGLLFLLTTGCATSFTRAKDDFKNGDAASARERLVAIEADASRWNDRDRAQYALYRGLVHLSLSDRDAALPWLKRADEMVRASPDTLTAEDRTRLRVALETSYGVRP